VEIVSYPLSEAPPPKITDVGLSYLSKCSELKVLSLETEGLEITDAGVACLRHLKQLGWLRMPRAAITDKGVDMLVEMESLRYLDMSGWSEVSDRGIRKLIESPHIESLSVPGPPQLSEDSFDRMIERFGNDVIVDGKPTSRFVDAITTP